MYVQNLMNSLWDIRIFLGLVPKETHCIKYTDIIKCVWSFFIYEEDLKNWKEK